MDVEENKSKIQALLDERRACEVRGLTERVKLIDDQLRLHGHGAETPAKRAERRPAVSARATKR